MFYLKVKPWSQVAHQAGAYPGFCSMKRLGVFLLPLGWDAVHRRVTPSIKFAGTHLYTWVERGTVRVKCLAQEHNTMSPGLEPRPLDPETSALTMRPPRLPYIVETLSIMCELNFTSCYAEKKRIGKLTFTRKL